MSEPNVPTSAIPLPTPPRRRWWRTLILAGLLFGSGALVGGASTVVFLAHRVRNVIQHPDEIPDRLSHRIAGRLGLTPEQTARLRERLAIRLASLRALQHSVQPQLTAELEGLRTDVKEGLTPDQAQAWDDLFDNLQDNWLPPNSPPTTSPSENAPG